MPFQKDTKSKFEKNSVFAVFELTRRSFVNAVVFKFLYSHDVPNGYRKNACPIFYLRRKLALAYRLLHFFCHFSQTYLLRELILKRPWATLY